MLNSQKIFSIPLNPKLNKEQYDQFFNFLKEYKDWIRDVYFTCRIAPFTQDAMGDVFVIETDSYSAIQAALNIQRTLDIPISATFNNIQVAPSQKNLDLWIKNFKPLYDAGIVNVTIPHTHWMATGQIKAAFPKLYVKNTILREVHTAQEVVNLAKFGFDYINLDRDLMRDHDKLREIKKAKQYIKDTLGKDIAISLLANEGCAGGCSMMEEHFHFNNIREGYNPQYFNDVISRVSCPKWEVTDHAIGLRTANFTPWREDWVEFIEELGIDSIKMHGRESVGRLYETMEIIQKFAAGAELLTPEFSEFINEANLEGKPITIWREKIKTCRFECWDCNYCDKVWESKSEIKFSELTNHVVKSIASSGIPTLKIDVPGLTSRRVQTLLNKIAQGVSTYMEVGTAMGATFCAVLKDNPIKAVAIDHWQTNVQPANGVTQLPDNHIEHFIANMERYKGDSSINVIAGDLFEVDLANYENLIEMWFYDGPHDLESTKRAVNYYWPSFTKEAVLIFDDANWSEVVEGARAGIFESGGNITYEKLMLNDQEDPNAWWNGLYIVVVRK